MQTHTHRKARFGGSFAFALAALAAVTMIAMACSDGESASVEQMPVIEVSALDSPALSGSGQPHLFTSPAGRIWMSWMEPEGEVHALRIAELDPATGDWNAPVTVEARDDFFVNWADFPSVTATADGTLFSHWLQKSGEGTYSYDVMVSRSRDEGTSWSEPVVLHDDGVETEHGFVSFAPISSDRLLAVWLDGRHMGAAHGAGSGAMTVRSAELRADGSIANRTEIDSRACECCQTSVASFGDGELIMVFRDRSDEEIRDIGYSIYSGGQWSDTRIVHDDGWEIYACPVNGPAVAVGPDEMAAVAWFTAADDTNRVSVAFSDDRGESFARPVRLDLGAPLGRVDILSIGEGGFLVSWLERTGNDTATVMARTVFADGRTGDPVGIGETSASRSSGFPRMSRHEDDVFVVYTDSRSEDQVVRLKRVSVRNRNEG